MLRQKPTRGQRKSDGKIREDVIKGGVFLASQRREEENWGMLTRSDCLSGIVCLGH